MREFRLLIAATVACLGCGCSVTNFAVDRLGDALSESGTAFSADDDPELIRDAAPFSLKLMEGLLARRPEHRGLLLACARGFTLYGYAFVQLDAKALERTDLERARELNDRARGLYLRGHEYGLRGLEAAHGGFRERLTTDPRAAVALAGREDVALLYWTGISLAAAVGVSKDDPALVSRLFTAEALIDRARALEPDFDRGAIDVFLITYEMVRANAPGDRAERSRAHLTRALEIASAREPGARVNFAESVCLALDDRECFEEQLQRALAADARSDPAFTLENVLMQRRARQLLDETDHLFLPALPEESRDE